MSTYFLSKNGGQSGPYTVNEIEELIGSGEFGFYDLCWREGMTDWKPIAEVIAFENISVPPRVDSVPSSTVQPLTKSNVVPPVSTSRNIHKERSSLTETLVLILTFGALLLFGYTLNNLQKGALPVSQNIPSGHFSRAAWMALDAPHFFYLFCASLVPLVLCIYGRFSVLPVRMTLVVVCLLLTIANLYTLIVMFGLLQPMESILSDLMEPT